MTPQMLTTIIWPRWSVVVMNCCVFVVSFYWFLTNCVSFYFAILCCWSERNSITNKWREVYLIWLYQPTNHDSLSVPDRFVNKSLKSSMLTTQSAITTCIFLRKKTKCLIASNLELSLRTLNVERDDCNCSVYFFNRPLPLAFFWLHHSCHPQPPHQP